MEELVRSVLEEQVGNKGESDKQFGEVKQDSNPQFWMIQMVNGVQISVNTNNWEVDGSDENIVNSVKEAIQTVLEAL